MFDALFSSLPVRFFIAFLIVLGLIGAFAWAIRRFGTGRLGGANTRGRQPRLGVIDYASVDARRRLILVRRDNVEHLIMIGGPTDVVVETNIVRAVAANPRDAVVPRSPTMEMPRAIPLPEPSNGGSWPLQPEPVAPTPRAAPRFEPLPEEPSHASVPLQPVAEMSAKPQRDTLAALADELSARPTPPTAPARSRNPLPARKPQAEARTPEPRLPDPPPGPAAAPVDASTDQSLAEMAHRLEAALRKPGAPAAPAAPQAAAAAEPAPPAPPQRAPRQAEPKPAPRADVKPNKSTTLYDNLEQEMASLLGRPPNKN
jgi:flagellar protein FliO/FliZ